MPLAWIRSISRAHRRPRSADIIRNLMHDPLLLVPLGFQSSQRCASYCTCTPARGHTRKVSRTAPSGNHHHPPSRRHLGSFSTICHLLDPVSPWNQHLEKVANRRAVNCFNVRTTPSGCKRVGSNWSIVSRLIARGRPAAASSVSWGVDRTLAELRRFDTFHLQQPSLASVTPHKIRPICRCRHSFSA